MRRKIKKPLRLGLPVCLLAAVILFAFAVPALAANNTSSYAGCQAMTESGCAGGNACQATCGSDTGCVTSGTTGTTAAQTKYAAGNTGSSSSGDGMAAVGLAVAGGIIAAAVIGFLLLNRKPKRR